MGDTKIEWATRTENWLAGCTKVSEACRHCYALTMSLRLASGLGNEATTAHYAPAVDLQRKAWTGALTYNPEALRRAFRRLRSARTAQRVFCNSMSDTFHDQAPRESLDDLAYHIREAGRERWKGDVWRVDTDSGRTVLHRRAHVIMLLTKRPANLLAWQREHFPAGLPSWVWVGCTVEDQKRADERIPVLVQVHAAVRFLSMEPLLGPVVLTPLALARLEQVITGGESGPQARPSHPQWYRDIRDQCVEAGVSYFHKQNGEWRAWSRKDFQSDRAWYVAEVEQQKTNVASMTWADMTVSYKVGKRAAGRLLDGRTWDEVPQ